MKAEELAGQFDNGIPLTESQVSILRDYIEQSIDKHQKLDRIEAELIDDLDKNVYYMWGQIKRRCLRVIGCFATCNSRLIGALL